MLSSEEYVTDSRGASRLLSGAPDYAIWGTPSGAGPGRAVRATRYAEVRGVTNPVS